MAMSQSYLNGLLQNLNNKQMSVFLRESIIEELKAQGIIVRRCIVGSDESKTTFRMVDGEYMVSVKIEADNNDPDGAFLKVNNGNHTQWIKVYPSQVPDVVHTGFDSLLVVA